MQLWSSLGQNSDSSSYTFSFIVNLSILAELSSLSHVWRIDLPFSVSMVFMPVKRALMFVGVRYSPTLNTRRLRLVTPPNDSSVGGTRIISSTEYFSVSSTSTSGQLPGIFT